MKRIYITIFLLLGVMITLAYLYFSKLNRDTTNGDVALHAATDKSGLIFCFQYEKSITDLLSSQDLIQRLMPEDQLQALHTLHERLLGAPELNALAGKQMVYLSFMPGEGKNLSFLLSTQTTEKQDPEALLNLFKANKMAVEKLNGFAKVTLSDTTAFYLAQKDRLILLSPSFKTITEGLQSAAAKPNDDFIAYIHSNHKLNKNSLATLYVNYSALQGLAAAITPERFNQIFPFFNGQRAYGNFSYSFSKSRILFNGSTSIGEDQNYLHLFAGNATPKVNINAILPAQTASYTLYTTGPYPQWQKKLQAYLQSAGRLDKINNSVQQINAKYRLDLNRTFPVYFQDQLLTFQLKSRETLGAINLNNGDKLSQLLLDLSTEYSPEIKQLKEPGLLAYYFGDAFSAFKKPYYTIIDNYMVFSNYASSVQVFLNSYKNNQQLINDKSYVSALNQLSAEADISYYLNRKNAANLARKNLFTPMYRLYVAENQLGRFDNFIYQMSGGDKNNFQTNILMNSSESLQDTIPSF